MPTVNAVHKLSLICVLTTAKVTYKQRYDNRYFEPGIAVVVPYE